MEVIELEGGMRVLLLPNTSAISVSVIALVKVGSRYETAETMGIAHFYEHIVHDGSEKFPTSKEFAEVLDAKGADTNAMTGEEYTGYYTKIESRHVKVAIEMMGELLVRPLLEEKEIEREKTVIVEEINMRSDSPHIKVIDSMSENLFKGNGLGLPGVGTSDSVQRISRSALLDFSKQFYVANNIVLVFSGRWECSDDELLSMVKMGFKGQRETRLENLQLDTVDGLLHEQSTVIIPKKTDQVHMALGYRGVSRFDSLRYAQALMVTALGDGFSSRLFQKIRQDLGLAYSVYADVDLYTDTSMILVNSGLKYANTGKVVAIICNELEHIANVGLEEGELRRCKDYLRGTMALRLENNLSRGMYYGIQLLLENRVISHDEIADRIESVTNDDVIELTNYILSGKPVIVAVGDGLTNNDFA